jgi:hypothetical protein
VSQAGPTISSGIVPGFPQSLPAHLESAWLTIVRKPQSATITPLPDGGVRIAFKKQPKALWGLIAFVTLGGVIMMVGAWLFDRHQQSADFDLPVRFNLTKLYIIAGMSIGAGLILMLIQIAGGADRDTVLDASKGCLRIDRYVSGDHIVREYSPEEIDAIWVDSGIGVDARLGAFSIAVFTAADVQVAAAEIIGTVFWGDDAVVSRNVHDGRAAGTAKLRVQRLDAAQSA